MIYSNACNPFCNSYIPSSLTAFYNYVNKEIQQFSFTSFHPFFCSLLWIHYLIKIKYKAEKKLNGVKILNCVLRWNRNFWEGWGGCSFDKSRNPPICKIFLPLSSMPFWKVVFILSLLHIFLLSPRNKICFLKWKIFVILWHCRHVSAIQIWIANRKFNDKRKLSSLQ